MAGDTVDVRRGDQREAVEIAARGKHTGKRAAAERCLATGGRAGCEQADQNDELAESLDHSVLRR